MKKEMDMRESWVTPINILKVIKAFNKLNRGDVLEIKLKDKRTKNYLFNFFSPSQIKEEFKEGFYKIILKK